ncbi:MAG: glutaredoxin family protein [Caldilineaceae bacterium]|jgi:mycoredoxin
MGNNNIDIVIYTTKWCPACWRAKQVMKSMQVSYLEVDIAADSAAAERVMSLNKGYRSVPTLVFPDGSHITEPQVHVLKEKLNSYT